MRMIGMIGRNTYMRRVSTIIAGLFVISLAASPMLWAAGTDGEREYRGHRDGPYNRATRQRHQWCEL
jgi:hypothetical protein